MKTILENYISEYQKEFDDDVVNAAVKYINNTGMFSDIPFTSKDKDDIKDAVRVDTFRAFMAGVSRTLYIGEDKVRKNSEEKRYKKFRKEKDFCVAFYFGDNDFGSDIEEAAKMYAKSYNYVLGCIDNYTDEEFEQIKDKSLYVKDIDKLEDTKIIKSILKTGFCSSYMKDYCTHIINIEKLDHDAIFSHANELIDYLNFEKDRHWFIGTIDDVSDKIMDKFKSHVDNPEITNISNIWLNGECLFMAVIDGEMKVWVR